MQDLLKIVKSLGDGGILLDGITETVKNEVKEQKVGFLSILLSTLGASLLGVLLTKKNQAEGLLEQEKQQLELVMNLKNFDCPPINKP